MKIKKTISEKVLAANQANGRKTAGPRNCDRSKMNAVTHGLLAKRLLLNESDAKDFEATCASLELEYEPQTATERMMLEDLSTLRWRLESAQTLLMRQLKNREKSAEIVFQMIAAERQTDELSKFTREDDLSSGAKVGWECTELSISSGNRTFAEEVTRENHCRNAANDPRASLSRNVHCENEQTNGSILVHAKVHTGIETIVRYEKSLRNDFYRALDILRRLKGKKGVSGPVSGRRDSTG